MKKDLLAAVLVIIALGLVSCGSKKKSDDIIAPKVEKVKPKDPVRMQEYVDQRDITWVEGNQYHIEVMRQPCDSLPMVKDETGQKYIDNMFRMTITRSNGSVFYKRTFTKKDFQSYINADYRDTGILEGVVFDRIDGDKLLFGASVGHPQTDEYIPFVMTLTRMGALTINQDTQLDTGSTQSLEPDSIDDDGV